MKSKATFEETIYGIEPDISQKRYNYLRRWLRADRIELTPKGIEQALRHESEVERERREGVGLPAGEKGMFLRGNRFFEGESKIGPHTPFMLMGVGRLVFHEGYQGRRSAEQVVESLKPILAMVEVWGLSLPTKSMRWVGGKGGDLGRIYISGTKVEAVPAMVEYPGPSWLPIGVRCDKNGEPLW